MKSDSSAPSWLRFFMSAGIQKDSAETYAVTFSKNQIQLDMLPEIKKEYLVDMGITLMGHIIAILRHAKTVHTEEVTKSTLSTNKPGSTVASKVSAPASKPVSKTTPIVVKDRVQTPAVASKVTPTPVKTVAPTARPRPTTEVVEVVEKRKEKPVPDVMVTKVSYGPKMPPKTAPPRPPELTPKRKLSDEEAGHVDESESKKKIFHRLGRAPSPEPSTNSSSVNGESVFARLGQKTAEPERLVPTVKVVAAPQKFPVKPIISLVKQPVAPAMRTTLIADPTPKEKVMMINKGVLTKTMRADQDAPSKILSSTTLSADHTSQTIQNARAGKNQVHYRLGRAAMDMMAPKPANSVKTKRVSFGSVIEKTIPSNTEPAFTSFKSRTNASALHSPYRRASVGAAGVFSRLGM